jgi:hypothetical protein
METEIVAYELKKSLDHLDNLPEDEQNFPYDAFTLSAFKDLNSEEIPGGMLLNTNAVRNLTTFVQQNFDSTRLPGIFPASSSLQERRDHIITLIGKDRIEALTPTKRNEFENLLNRLRMLLTSLSSPVINCDNNTQHWLF